MKYYIQITLLPNDEIGQGFLWQKIYQQIHLALVSVKKDKEDVNIGTSFPKYNNKTISLGNTIRLFANSPEDLKAISLDQWFSRLSDYITMTEIKDVPQKIEQYAIFSRKQVKSNMERLARRQAKRKGISLEDAMKNYENMQEQTIQLPFILIKSLSTNQTLKLFIRNKLTTAPVEGNFNIYGLSKEATVPCF